MNIIGLIAEYNPFHNGHIYHINEIKKRYPDSLLIAIINGYFTERGTISIISKEDKTKIALNNNIDIVLELPFIYGTQSSDIFAENSIKILNEFKVDRIIFGSESNNIELIKDIAKIQESDNYNIEVKKYLDQGLNYPTAMAKALHIDKNFNNPNDLLGISYVKAINKINPNIIPETIKRTNDYHDILNNSNIVSASNIREKLKNEEDISNYLPKISKDAIHNVSNDNLFNYLKFKIITDNNISSYLDVDEGLDYRLRKSIENSSNIDELIMNVKTKRYTYNKINRMFTHIMIGLTKEDNKNAKLDYIKILGFNTLGQEYIHSIKKDFTIPTIPNKDSIIYKYELKAAYLYEEATKKSLNNFDNKNIPIKKN